MEGKVYIASSIGIHLEQNKDSILIGQEVFSASDRANDLNIERDLPETGLVCVADGVGVTADDSAVSCFFLETLAGMHINSPEMLPEAMEYANHLLLDLANHQPDLKQMYTTMTGIYLYADYNFCVHVGNTRAYILHDHHLEQITTDQLIYLPQSEVNLQINQDHIYIQGVPKRVDQLTVFECLPFDTLLLTTDGIHDHVAHDVLEQIMSSSREHAQKLNKIIQAAKEAGSHDDLTAVMICLNSNRISHLDCNCSSD